MLPALVAFVVLAADLITKAWAVVQLVGHPPRSLWPGRLRLELAINPGAAFGLLGEGGRLLMVGLSVAMLAYLLRLTTRPWTRSPLAATALGAMLGGTLGNLHDRLWRTVDDGNLWGAGPQTGVVDFIVVEPWPGSAWPAFNIADLALWVGGILLLGALWRARD